VLWILAGVSIALLIYEGWTLGTSVLLPLLDNPNILQTDFHYYYEAAVRFRGDAAKLYLPTDDVIAGFTYPPPAIVPFVLLSHAPLGPAFLIFTLASYAALFGAVWMWLAYLRERGREVDIRTAIALTLVAAALGPTYMNAIFGQVNSFVLACSVAFIALAAARPMASGALLATGIWLKVYPALLAAVGIWDRGARRAIGLAAMAGLIIAIAALLVVPVDAYRSFLDVLSTRADKTAVHITNQSLMAFVERFFLAPAEFLNWTGREAVTTGAVLRVANWIFGLAVIALLWTRARSHAGAAVHSTAALIALAAVIAPLGWGHTFVLVLPLVITHLAASRQSPALATVVVAGCVLALMVPAGRRFAFVEQFPAWTQNVFYSRYLLAAFVLIALPAPVPRFQGSKVPEL
jgi:alpha-1,2-mannosyltransferase